MIILPSMKSIIGKKINISTEKIIVGGLFTNYNGGAEELRIIKLNPDGSIDTGFDTYGTGFDWEVNALAVQSDGKIVVGGYFTIYKDYFPSSITRLNSDATLDTEFIIGEDFYDSQVYAIAIQSDGKIVVGGSFYTYNGYLPSITRLNSDGSTDIGFTTGTGFDGAVRTVGIQSDGKIVVGGNFYYYDGTVQANIARLNSDGSLDTGFMIGTGFNSNVSAVAIQSDGKIVVAGNFSDYNGTSQLCITRLNSNGTRDVGFTVGTGFDGLVSAVAIQSDGKILVGGSFSSYNETPQPYIARLNSDGTRDTGFAATGFNWDVKTIAVQSDGKIIAGGGSFVRLNSNGTLDTGFNAGGSGFNEYVNSIKLIQG